MGNGMDRVLPGLFLGSFRDGKDEEQLEANKISHIVSIHDNARAVVQGKQYLCIRVPDSPDENLSKYFPQCNDFIHTARLQGGNVLIHCLAGVSRSVTIAVAYIMSVTNLSSKDALKVVKGARNIANPNYGFITQLKDFEFHSLIMMSAIFWQVYVIKYVELLDTVIYVLMKKFHNIQPLHVIHHNFVPSLGFVCCRYEQSTYLSLFVFVNSSVHLVMYSYYGLSAMGPQFQKYLWWKKYLTLIQMAQFLAMTSYMSIMYLLGCVYSPFIFYLGSCGTMVIFFLFLDFYKKSFKVNDKPLVKTAALQEQRKQQ